MKRITKKMVGPVRNVNYGGQVIPSKTKRAKRARWFDKHVVVAGFGDERDAEIRRLLRQAVIDRKA